MKLKAQLKTKPLIFMLVFLVVILAVVFTASQRELSTLGSADKEPVNVKAVDKKTSDVLKPNTQDQTTANYNKLKDNGKLVVAIRSLNSTLCKKIHTNELEEECLLGIDILQSALDAKNPAKCLKTVYNISDTAKQICLANAIRKIDIKN